MIEFVKAYKAKDGKTYASLQEAQVAELNSLLPVSPDDECYDVLASYREEIFTNLVKNADAVVNILTTKPTSKHRARKLNGGSKKRKPAPEATTEQTVLEREK